MILQDLKNVLNARCLCGDKKAQTQITCVAASDLMSDVLTFVKSGSLLLTGLTNPQVVRTAEMAEVIAVCFVNGKEPPPETVTLAKDKNIPLFVAPGTLFDACGRLYESGVRSCI